jgi:hypothetical protein
LAQIGAFEKGEAGVRAKWINVWLVLVLGVLAVTRCAPATEPQPIATPEPTSAPSSDDVNEFAVAARDAALAYLTEIYGERAPASGLSWTGQSTTPEGLVGSQSYRYAAGDWTIAISYPVTAPAETVYQVIVANEATGFQWEGEVNAAGTVVERVGPGGQPVMPSEVTEADLVELVKGNGAFAFDLYRVLKEEKGNLFYSPYSISLALAMTYAGARGETEQQMADALHFLLSQDRLHPAFSAMGAELAGRGEGAKSKDGEGFRLNIVNAIWGQEGYAFLPAFLGVLDRNYGAGLRLVDFVNAAEAVRVTINDWISEQTEGRIEDLSHQA